MTLSAVCLDCAAKLVVQEFGTVPLDLKTGSRCDSCGTELVNENGPMRVYAAVTPEQLAEIRARE